MQLVSAAVRESPGAFGELDAAGALLAPAPIEAKSEPSTSCTPLTPSRATSVADGTTASTARAPASPPEPYRISVRL